MARQNVAWKVLGLVCALGMCGCSDKEDPYKERPAEELYQEGMQNLKNKKYEKAAKAFDEVERQHPYSKWAPKAQLMAGYAHYEGQQYEKAIAAMEAFVQLHPAHQDVPYALYMQGMCFYEQLSPVERDQKITELALNVFEDLVRRFPESSYAKDARYKIDLLRDNLAGKEMDVGRYYQKRGSYLSAMNRFRVVVEKFQTTQHVGEALYRLIEVYLALGMRAEAEATAAVLGHNFPGSEWYQDGYNLLKNSDAKAQQQAQDSSWISKIWPMNKKAEAASVSDTQKPEQK